MSNEQEWVNLYGNDGKIKASFNIRTGELAVKDRGNWHHWNLAAMVKADQNADTFPVEKNAVVC